MAWLSTSGSLGAKGRKGLRVTSVPFEVHIESSNVE